MGSFRRVADARSEVRLTVNIAVTVRPYLSPAQHLLMADVSTAGALITGAFHGLAKGQEVILTIGAAASIVATIAWMEQRTFGLTFHRRMHGYEFDAVMLLGAVPAPTGHVAAASHPSLNG